MDNNKIIINIIHPSLNRYGGAELICLEMISILKKKNHQVNLYTIDKVKWRILYERLGIKIKPNKEYYHYKKMPSLNNNYIKWIMLTSSYIKLLTSSVKTSAITINNYGDTVPVISDFCYIHSVPIYTKYNINNYNPYQIPLWNVTSKLIKFIIRLLQIIYKESKYITNSKFNKAYINNEKAIVINPPVNVTYDAQPKQNVILTISRINVKKRLHMIPIIASQVKNDCEFVIMGSIDENSRTALNQLYQHIRDYNVVNRVKIIVDPTREEIERKLAVAIGYLSTQPTEAFGIAVVEAMANRAVPVVPKEGGPWTDILD